MFARDRMRKGVGRATSSAAPLGEMERGGLNCRHTHFKIRNWKEKKKAREPQAALCQLDSHAHTPRLVLPSLRTRAIHKEATAPPRPRPRMGSLAPGAAAPPPRKLASFVLLTALYLGCVFPLFCLALVAWWRGSGHGVWAQGWRETGRGARSPVSRADPV